MRTPRWWLDHPSPSDESWIAAIQSDARAGMVPEGELQEAKARDELNGECIMLMRVAQTIEKLRRASYDASHAANTKLHDALVAAKAELAKAWEAAASAQRASDVEAAGHAPKCSFSDRCGYCGAADCVRDNPLVPLPKGET